MAEFNGQQFGEQLPLFNNRRLNNASRYTERTPPSGMPRVPSRSINPPAAPQASRQGSLFNEGPAGLSPNPAALPSSPAAVRAGTSARPQTPRPTSSPAPIAGRQGSQGAPLSAAQTTAAVREATQRRRAARVAAANAGATAAEHRQALNEHRAQGVAASLNSARASRTPAGPSRSMGAGNLTPEDLSAARQVPDLTRTPSGNGPSWAGRSRTIRTPSAGPQNPTQPSQPTTPTGGGGGSSTPPPPPVQGGGSPSSAPQGPSGPTSAGSASAPAATTTGGARGRRGATAGMFALGMGANMAKAAARGLAGMDERARKGADKPYKTTGGWAKN